MSYYKQGGSASNNGATASKPVIIEDLWSQRNFPAFFIALLTCFINGYLCDPAGCLRSFNVLGSTPVRTPGWAEATPLTLLVNKLFASESNGSYQKAPFPRILHISE